MLELRGGEEEAVAVCSRGVGVVKEQAKQWRRLREVGVCVCVGGALMGAAWRHASLPPPPGLVSLRCQMKSCN